MFISSIVLSTRVINRGKKYPCLSKCQLCLIPVTPVFNTSFGDGLTAKSDLVVAERARYQTERH